MINVQCRGCKVTLAYDGILFVPDTCPGCGASWPFIKPPGFFAARRLLKHAEGFQRGGFNLWHYKHLGFIQDREALHLIISPNRDHSHNLLHYYELAARICAYIVGEPLPEQMWKKADARPRLRKARNHVRAMTPLEGD